MEEFVETRKEYNRQSRLNRATEREARGLPHLPPDTENENQIEYASDRMGETYSMSDMAEELGYNSVAEMTTVLRNKNIIRWITRSAVYVIAPKYAPKYLLITQPDQRYSYLYSVWTEKGREFLLELKEKGELL
jgi:hypothetical protein